MQALGRSTRPLRRISAENDLVFFTEPKYLPLSFA
jgi:hypothetical protein